MRGASRTSEMWRSSVPRRAERDRWTRSCVLRRRVGGVDVAHEPLEQPSQLGDIFGGPVLETGGEQSAALRHGGMEPVTTGVVQLDELGAAIFGVAGAPHQTGPLELSYVPRDRRGVEIGVTGQLGHPQWAQVSQGLQHPEAAGVEITPRHPLPDQPPDGVYRPDD